MFGPYALEMLALVVAVGGLVAVIAEIVMKDPAALSEIATDTQAMAQPARRPWSLPSSATAISARPLDAGFISGTIVRYCIKGQQRCIISKTGFCFTSIIAKQYSKTKGILTKFLLLCIGMPHTVYQR